MTQELPNEIQELTQDLFPIEPLQSKAIMLVRRAFEMGKQCAKPNNRWESPAVEYSAPTHFNVDKIEIVKPNEYALAIVRLFLEKLEVLTADERKEILTVIRFINTPYFLVNPEVQR